MNRENIATVADRLRNPKPGDPKLEMGVWLAIPAGTLAPSLDDLRDHHGAITSACIAGITCWLFLDALPPGPGLLSDTAADLFGLDPVLAQRLFYLRVQDKLIFEITPADAANALEALL